MLRRTLMSLAFGLAGCVHPALGAGQPVPAFHVPAHDGSDLTLERFAGKWIVFWFFPKADTPG